MTVGTGGSVAASGSGTITATNIVAGTGTASIAGPTDARIITIDDAAQTLAARNRDNTFTENNTFGNADTDTLTLRSLLVGGNSRAIWIAGSAPTPTYATGTNELYVAGDIESGGTVYAANFQTTGTGESYLSMANNDSRAPTASAYEVYFEGGTDLKFNINGSEKTTARLEDAQTFTGLKTLQGGAYVGDASNAAVLRLYDGSSNYWALSVPALSGDYTLVLPSSAGTTGQYLKTTTAAGTATLSWDTPTATAAGASAGMVQYNATGEGGALTASAHFVYTEPSAALLTIGSEGASGKTGNLALAYEGGASDYTATVAPNSGMAADITITLPASTGTLATLGANTFTGTQALGANNLTMTGSLAATGARVTKGWFTDIESTNMPTVGGTAILSSLTAPVFTTSIEAPFIILGSAATAADAGTIRMPNAGSIQFEADAAGTDINALSVDSSEIIQIGSAGASGVTITPATTITGALTVNETNGLLIGATGVKITSDNDGAITFTGNSAGYDEDLTINLDDTENTAVVSSSTGVTKIDYSALNLVTTGYIQGGINISSDADGMDASAMTAAGMYGTMFIATGAGTWTLPRAALGMSVCLMDSGTAHDLILDVTAGSTIRLKGTEGADGVGITNASGSTTGDFVCVVAVATDKWSTVGMSGTWASQ